MLIFFENVRKSKQYKYKILGVIPVKEKGKIFFIYPKVDNYIEEIEEQEAIIYKKYKNKYILSNQFFDEKFLINDYNKVFSKVPILESSSAVFDEKEHSFIITETTDISELENSPSIKRLNNLYNKDKVKDILEEILLQSKKEFSIHDEYEDYSYTECLKITLNSKLESLFKDVSNNIEEIYIIQSLIYIDFVNLYYELYEYTKNE